MDTKKELKILFWMIVVFVAVFFMPLGSERFMTAVDATFDLAKWYAQEHVVLCHAEHHSRTDAQLRKIKDAEHIGKQAVDPQIFR